MMESVPVVQVQRHNPPELWFDASCAEDMRLQLVRATVRLGMRNARHPKGYLAGERCYVRCREPSGTDAHECWVWIARLQFMPFSAITDRNLARCPRNERTLRDLRALLERCYGALPAADERMMLVEFSFAEHPV